MATNPYGRDTVNISLNVPRAERILLGQLACRRDQSLGSLVRGLYLGELARRDPATARQIAEHRTLHRAATLGAATLGAATPTSDALTRLNQVLPPASNYSP